MFWVLCYDKRQTFDRDVQLRPTELLSHFLFSVFMAVGKRNLKDMGINEVQFYQRNLIPHFSRKFGSI
jgi:hypothetical protein